MSFGLEYKVEQIKRYAEELETEAKEFKEKYEGLANKDYDIKEFFKYEKPPEYNVPDLENKIKEWKAKCEKTTKKNKELIENNWRVFNTIKALLNSIGLKDQTSYFKTARSRNRTFEQSKWLSDLSLCIRRVDGKPDFEYETRKLLNKKQDEEYKLKKEQKKKEKETKEKEIKQRESRVILLYSEKYGLDPLECSVEEILEKIIEKDKYLYLGYYLEKNREDWTDGCDYAKMGLNNFEISTEKDIKIYDHINDLVENWDGDGRVFRDCEYNYSVFYDMVDDGLLSDFSKVKQFIG